MNIKSLKNREVEFAKLYPMENSTVLVWNLDGEIEVDEYSRMASMIMEEKYVPCEQVGFIEKPVRADVDCQLRMMGGELCVNALRSIAYLYFLKNGDPEIRIGVPHLEEVFVAKVGEDGKVDLSFGMQNKYKKLSDNLYLIHLDGISHFVELRDDMAMSDEELRRKLGRLFDEYEIEIGEIDAVGYIPCEKESFAITPVVFVRDTDTMIVESSCGSGSIAAAFVKTKQESNVSRVGVLQPSGAVFEVSFADGLNEVGKTDFGDLADFTAGGQKNGDEFLQVSIGSYVEMPVEGKIFCEI